MRGWRHVPGVFDCGVWGVWGVCGRARGAFLIGVMTLDLAGCTGPLGATTRFERLLSARELLLGFGAVEEGVREMDVEDMVAFVAARREWQMGNW